MARDMSARRVFMTTLRSIGERLSEPQPLSNPPAHSMRSHIHGSNRNRIALHVMLKDIRNRTRCRW